MIVIFNLLTGIGKPPGQMDPKAFLLQKFNVTARQRVSSWFPVENALLVTLV